jgi:tRNA(Arg) A34 adenosine deaminase TadA
MLSNWRSWIAWRRSWTSAERSYTPEALPLRRRAHHVYVSESKPNPSDPQLVNRLLDVIERDIAPRTRAGVVAGNKLFGAAILKKSDLSLVIAETNNELENPLWHGEVHALKRFYELPAAERPATRDCIFLATHEPCSLCLSAITWTGFDNFFYLFSHEDSRDSFNIPHDLKILKEVFDVDPHGYRSSNAYWTAHSLSALAPASLAPRIAALTALYAELSEIYQASKSHDAIPLA